MSRALEIMNLSAEDSYAAAAERVVAVRTSEVFALRRGVLDLEDIERVHDMRVATRRLRAALEIFAPCFPPRRRRKALRDVKALADALGERRDRDVQIAALGEISATAGAAESEAIAVVIAQLRREQRRANRDLRRALRNTKRTRRRLERLSR